MAVAANAIMIAYHGCDEAMAQRVIDGRDHIAPSQRPSDWLGRGAYFWESDPVRAMEWARVDRRQALPNPAVVGAVIEIGNCLDLTRREDIDLVGASYRSLQKRVEVAGDRMPENRAAMGETSGDYLIRELDNAVLQELHAAVANAGLAPYDTVRAMFREGPEIYPGAGFYLKTHVQVAVLDPQRSILGYFRPRTAPK